MFPEAFFDVSTMFAWEIAAVLSKTSTSIVLPSKLSSKFSTLRLPFFKFVWSILIFSELLQLRGGLYIYVLCMTQQILKIKILYIIIVMLIYYQYTSLHLFLKNSSVEFKQLKVQPVQVLYRRHILPFTCIVQRVTRMNIFYVLDKFSLTSEILLKNLDQSRRWRKSMEAEFGRSFQP